jgi:hypothetical protein
MPPLLFNPEVGSLGSADATTDSVEGPSGSSFMMAADLTVFRGRFAFFVGRRSSSCGTQRLGLLPLRKEIQGNERTVISSSSPVADTTETAETEATSLSG